MGMMPPPKDPALLQRARLLEVLKHLQNIEDHSVCPDPAEGGCIPSNACAHENAVAGRQKLEQVLKELG